jgi:GNAT superfamily N-acetyltransferase
VRVRPLVKDDLVAAAVLHRRVLNSEFLSHCGLVFMRTYYQAWVEAPGSISIAAVDESGDLLGALLGATDPATHIRAMVRRRGLTIGFRLVAYAMGHPALAKDLIVTRARRYARGVARLVVARPGRLPRSSAGAAGVGEVTHLFVRLDRQGPGIGCALLDAAVEAARHAGVDELVLVTAPDLAARKFYERLGWLADGEMSRRSGEPFVRYRLPLTAGTANGDGGADTGGLPAINH